MHTFVCAYVSKSAHCKMIFVVSKLIYEMIGKIIYTDDNHVMTVFVCMCVCVLVIVCINMGIHIIEEK